MSVHELDVSSLAGFRATVAWVRKEIILARSSGFAELRARLQGGSCALFIDRRDAYIVAFRGRDRVYALGDATHDYARQLVAAKTVAAGEVQRIEGLTVTHPALGTLGYTFSEHDLKHSPEILNHYSSASPAFGELRRPLAFLVCLLAESARSPAIAFELEHLWKVRLRHDPQQDVLWPDASHHVKASEMIQCYDKAIRITRYAYAAFPQYVRPLDRIVKLEKRAVEIAEIWNRVGDVLKARSNQKAALDEIARDGKLSGCVGHDSDLRRLREIARELKLASGGELREVKDLCSEQAAMDFARSGVIAPDLAPPSI